MANKAASRQQRVLTTALVFSILGGATTDMNGGRKAHRAPSSSVGQRTVMTSSAAGSATFSGIGFLPGDNSSQVRAVSADGSVAIGASGSGSVEASSSGRTGVKWTSAGGLVALPALSADGSSQASVPFLSGSDITPSGSWIAYRTRPGGNGRREAVVCSGDFSQVIALGR